MASVTPPTRVGARANASARSQRSQRSTGPKDLGPRGKSSKPYSATKPKSVAKTPSSPNTRAIVSRTPDPKGKMSAAQLKGSTKRTKAKMKAGTKASKPSGAAPKSVRNVTRAVNTLRGGAAGIALGVASEHRKATKAAQRKQFERATGKKLST